jgi:amino acid permease
MVIAAQEAHPNYPLPRQLRKLRGQPSISSIGKVLELSLLSDLIVLITCLGFAVSYLVSIGEVMVLVMNDIQIENIILTSKYFWIVVGSALILFISFEDDVGDLWWYGTVSLLCVFYVAGLIIFSSFKSELYWESIVFPQWKVQMFDSLPIFVFAFTCHQNLFSIYKNIHATYLSGQKLDQAKLRHIYTTIDFSVLFVGVLYCIVGLCGFLTFGKDTQMIILNNCN